MNFVTVDSPLDAELRREQLEGLGLPPRLDLPAEQPELRHRRRLEVVDDVTVGNRFDAELDRPVSSRSLLLRRQSWKVPIPE